MKPKKIIGGTVGMGLPKPDLMQTDPTKGDYVKGKEEFVKQVSPDSGQNVTNADASNIKTVLGNIMAIIKAQTDSEGGVERPQGYNMDVSGLVAQNDVLIAALGGSGDSGDDTPEKTMTSISAAYSGDSVPVGTDVSELAGVTVTAYYSDGTTETVTGYTLSGTIAEGSNTITVSYGGKTASFSVVGYSPDSVTKVMFSDLEQETGLIMADGITYEKAGVHVVLPYVDGMLVSTHVMSTWLDNGFFPFVVLDGGEYKTPEYEQTTAMPQWDSSVCTATLSGYSADAVVYANIRSVNEHCYYEYGGGV